MYHDTWSAAVVVSGNTFGIQGTQKQKLPYLQFAMQRVPSIMGVSVFEGTLPPTNMGLCKKAN